MNIREATKHDAEDLAYLINLAGEGLPEYLWSLEAGSTEELESIAPGSWYINAIATYEDFQGRGFGSRLMTSFYFLPRA